MQAININQPENLKYILADLTFRDPWTLIFMSFTMAV